MGEFRLGLQLNLLMCMGLVFQVIFGRHISQSLCLVFRNVDVLPYLVATRQ